MKCSETGGITSAVPCTCDSSLGLKEITANKTCVCDNSKGYSSTTTIGKCFKCLDGEIAQGDKCINCKLLIIHIIFIALVQNKDGTQPISQRKDDENENENEDDDNSIVIGCGVAALGIFFILIYAICKRSRIQHYCCKKQIPVIISLCFPLIYSSLASSGA